MRFKVAAIVAAMTVVVAGSFFMARNAGKDDAITASDNVSTTDWVTQQPVESNPSILKSSPASSLTTADEGSSTTASSGSPSSTTTNVATTSKSNSAAAPKTNNPAKPKANAPSTAPQSSDTTKPNSPATTSSRPSSPVITPKPNNPETTAKPISPAEPKPSTPVATARPSDPGTTSGGPAGTSGPVLPSPVDQSDGGPVKAPRCGTYWGAYVNSPSRTGGSSAADKLRALQIVEDKSGRTFDLDHQFYRWDDFLGTGGSSHHIDNYIKPTINQGRIPFISWKPVMKNNDNISWASIANGSRDSVIREKARKVKSIGSPVILVFGHEADARIGAFKPGKTEGGHVKTDAGSAQDFVDAWKHVHDVFRAEGVTNVSWAWVMTRAPFTASGERAADNLYPGDKYVDIIGIDPYNFFHGQRNWVEMETLMQGFTTWNETRNTNKPWMIAEWGSVEDPNQTGRKAQWLRNAADYFESEPRLKYITHFDSYPEFNWKIDTSPSSQEAWRQISNRPYFKQKC